VLRFAIACNSRYASGVRLAAPSLSSLLVVACLVPAFALSGAAAGCDDGGRTTPTPLPTATSTTPRDSGSSPQEGWGDPLATKRPGVLRIAQLNVRRFFDATCDSGQCGASGFEEQPTQQQYDDRVAQLAAGLAKLEADVITLAEVETQGCLDAVQAKLKENGFEYPVAKVAEIGTPGSVDVAVLARGKFESLKTHRKETEPLLRPDGSQTIFTRELPEVHLTIGTTSVIVFAAHFRSKSDDDPGRRLAEAKKTQELMVAAGTANTGALVLLGGDLNDIPGSDAINAIEKDAALVRVAKDLPVAEQGTYRFSGQNQAIDHIYTTANRATAYVAKSATVLREGNSGFAGSDHATIYADFNLPE